MTKAFDVKDLVVRLEGKGLKVAEELAVVATSEIFAWLSDSCNVSENVMLKIVPPILAVIEPMVLKAEDKIDGVVS